MLSTVQHALLHVHPKESNVRASVARLGKLCEDAAAATEEGHQAADWLLALPQPMALPFWRHCSGKPGLVPQNTAHCPYLAQASEVWAEKVMIVQILVHFGADPGTFGADPGTYDTDPGTFATR